MPDSYGRTYSKCSNERLVRYLLGTTDIDNPSGIHVPRKIDTDILREVSRRLLKK